MPDVHISGAGPLMCMGPTHRIIGAYAGAGYGWATAHGPWWWAQAATCAALATVTAAGPTSPDMDQYKLWRCLDRWLPDELLGDGGPLQHRGISHFWGIPALLAAVLVVSGHGAWPLWALIVGWTSHLVADWFFGREGYGRGPGIPFGPWFWHHGVGLDTGGWLEHVLYYILFPPAVLLAIRRVIRRALAT